MTEDTDDALADVRSFIHADVDVEDDGRRLVGPGGTELIDGHGPYDPTTWIDRRSRWGSPFKTESAGGDYERHESVDLYRGWFLGKIETGEWDPETLRGETLACHCVPERCHGMVILNYLAETYDPQQTLGGDF